VAELRTEQALDPEPMAAYARSGYDEQIAAERDGGTQAGWAPQPERVQPPRPFSSPVGSPPVMKPA
jgi:hypothetical protein